MVVTQTNPETLAVVPVSSAGHRADGGNASDGSDDREARGLEEARRWIARRLAWEDHMDKLRGMGTPEGTPATTGNDDRAVPAISVRGLVKCYGAHEVLHDVSFDVESGEVLGLLGPNGAGKTTTIEILEGYRAPTEGTVRVLGFDPWTHPRPLRPRMGVVLQECGFPPHLRVVEVVDAWRSYYLTPRPTAELLDIVELTDEGTELVRRLSGGQRRRLDFALALAGDPDLVFLDEPTTGFDPEARRRCWTVIDNLSSLGKTVLLTTHYLDEAERLSDRVAILADGRIRAVGTSVELARLADTPTTISFAAPAANPPARWLRGRGGTVIGDGRVTVRTRDVGATLKELMREVGDLEDLVVNPPALEDTYLRLLERSATSS